MLKTLCLAVILLLTFNGYCGEVKISPGDEILAAYADMQYIQARKLADKNPALPEARLVNALCAVFDRRKQDLAYGLTELKKIYEDKGMAQPMRIEAGLSYARAAQTLQMRPGVYPVAEAIDFNRTYDEIIAGYPDTSAAVFAVIYQAQGCFDSSDKEKVEKGFIRLNDMLRNFRGPSSLLSPVHYMLARQYIINGRSYEQAVRHLEAAREIGIANPRNREQVAFRIARIYDFYLHDRTAAELNYQRFLKEFPNSANAPVARRYLKNMTCSEKGAGNG